MSPSHLSTAHESSPSSDVAVRVRSGPLRGAVVLLLALSVLFNAGTIGLVPAGIADDDGAYASAAYTFWRTGRPGVPGYRDVVDMNRDVWAFGRLAAAFQGAAMAVTGVSLTAAMIPTFLAGLLLLVVTGGLARTLAGPAAAIVAVLALAASGKFFLSTHGMRPDVLFAAFLVGSLWLIAARGSDRPLTSMLSAGLVMGISTDVHINGFFLSPVPAVFWLAATPPSPRAWWRGLAAYGGGLGLGFMCWAALHYAPDPDLFRRQLPIMGGATHGFRLLRLGLFGALAAESDRYVDWFWNARGHRHVPEAICILGGMAWAVLRGGRTLRATVIAWVALFLSSAVFLSNPFGWYLIYAWPLFSIWMACAFVATRRAAVAWSCAAVLLATHACDAALWTYKAIHDVPFSRQAADLRELVPADASVLGSGCWWFAFWDRDFTDIAYVSFRTLENREAAGNAGVWPAERSRLAWSYVVASNRLLRQLDPSLSEGVACDGPNADAPNAMAARRYVQSHTSKMHVLDGLDNKALVFTLTPDAPR